MKTIVRIEIKDQETFDKMEELKKALNIKTTTKLVSYLTDNLYNRLLK